MHVEGKLTLSLQALLFWCYLRVSLDHDTLCQEFFLPATSTNFLESVLGFIHQICSEGAKTNLNESPIEEDLSIDREIADCFLQVRHQKHISGFVILVM